MLKAGNKDVCIIHKCTTIRHALKAQSMGCDMISLDGFDCAGHPGETDVGNFILQPVAARKLGIPYVTSGGVGDGKQLAASLAMGAEGVNMGTRFMATAEAPIHANIKQALVQGDENSTQLVMRTLKNTERVYKNKTSDEVLRIEAESPGQIDKIYHLVKGDVSSPPTACNPCLAACTTSPATATRAVPGHTCARTRSRRDARALLVSPTLAHRSPLSRRTCRTIGRASRRLVTPSRACGRAAR